MSIEKTTTAHISYEQINDFIEYVTTSTTTSLTPQSLAKEHPEIYKSMSLTGHAFSYLSSGQTWAANYLVPLLKNIHKDLCPNTVPETEKIIVVSLKERLDSVTMKISNSEINKISTLEALSHSFLQIFSNAVAQDQDPIQASYYDRLLHKVLTTPPSLVDTEHLVMQFPTSKENILLFIQTHSTLIPELLLRCENLCNEIRSSITFYEKYDNYIERNYFDSSKQFNRVKAATAIHYRELKLINLLTLNGLLRIHHNDFDKGISLLAEAYQRGVKAKDSSAFRQLLTMLGTYYVENWDFLMHHIKQNSFIQQTFLEAITAWEQKAATLDSCNAYNHTTETHFVKKKELEKLFNTIIDQENKKS